MAHAYETGRLNLPFVGIATFGKRPYVEDWSGIRADAAILGAPFDFGTQFLQAGFEFGADIGCACHARFPSAACGGDNGCDLVQNGEALAGCGFGALV